MLKTNNKIQFSYTDYKNFTRFEPETKHYELLNGEIIMVPSPGYGHQCASRNLELVLWNYVRKNSLGTILDAPFDIHLGNEVVQPDIIYVSKERRNIIKKNEIKGAPELIVEILSPGTARIDKTYKKTLYAKHGVKEYWMTDPEAETVEAFSLAEGKYTKVGKYSKNQTLTSILFPKLKIKLKEIFDIE